MNVELQGIEATKVEECLFLLIFWDPYNDYELKYLTTNSRAPLYFVYVGMT